DTSLRTAATICSLIVLANCWLIASDVRHHNRLEAAAVTKIAVSTSAGTARPMLMVHARGAARGCPESCSGRGETATILTVPFKKQFRPAQALPGYSPAPSISLRRRDQVT